MKTLPFMALMPNSDGQMNNFCIIITECIFRSTHCEILYKINFSTKSSSAVTFITYLS